MKNTVIHGDCLELMKDIPDKSIDMILCDLPYGTTACKWDTIIPFEPLWEQYYRILRPNGFIALTASQPFTTKLINSNIERFSHQWIWKKEQGSNPFLANVMPMKNFEDIIVFSNEYKYDKEHPEREYFKKIIEYIGLNKKTIVSKIGQGADHCFRFNSTQFGICTQQTYNKLESVFNIKNMEGYQTYEEIFEIDMDFMGRYKRVYNPQKTTGAKYKSGGGLLKHTDSIVIGGNVSNERYPNSIIEFNTDKSKSQHPTQKPVALFEYLIKTYTNEGDLVLDNCAGSGTTGVACKNLNRNFILIEKEQEYIDIINKRLT